MCPAFFAQKRMPLKRNAGVGAFFRFSKATEGMFTVLTYLADFKTQKRPGDAVAEDG